MKSWTLLWTCKLPNKDEAAYFPRFLGSSVKGGWFRWCWLRVGETCHPFDGGTDRPAGSGDSCSAFAQLIMSVLCVHCSVSTGVKYCVTLSSYGPDLSRTTQSAWCTFFPAFPGGRHQSSWCVWGARHSLPQAVFPFSPSWQLQGCLGLSRTSHVNEGQRSAKAGVLLN